MLPMRLQVLLAASTMAGAEQPCHTAPSLADEVRQLGDKPGVIVVDEERVVAAAANLTIPKTVLLRFEVGGFLLIEQGASVTVNGALDAPMFSIFDGPGKGNVRFGCCPQLVSVAYPQWWGSATDGAADDTAAIQAALNSFPHDQKMIDQGMDPRGQVIFPRGIYKVTKPIILAGSIELIGHGAVLRGIVTPAGRAMIEPPDRGLNRTDGWTIRGMRFDGIGRGPNADLPNNGSMIGLDLTQTSYLLLEDFSFSHFHTAIKMSGGDMSANEFNGHPCMYNIFRQGNIGSCHTAIVTNYSITNRFHDLQIGNVVDGMVVDASNQIDIENVAIEFFTGTAISVRSRHSDTVHIQDVFFSIGPIGIEIEPGPNSCLVQNPRFTHVDTPLIDNGTDTMILYNTVPGWEGGSLCKLPSECFPA